VLCCVAAGGLKVPALLASPAVFIELRRGGSNPIATIVL